MGPTFLCVTMWVLLTTRDSEIAQWLECWAQNYYKSLCSNRAHARFRGPVKIALCCVNQSKSALRNL